MPLWQASTPVTDATLVRISCFGNCCPLLVLLSVSCLATTEEVGVTFGPSKCSRSFGFEVLVASLIDMLRAQQQDTLCHLIRSYKFFRWNRFIRTLTVDHVAVLELLELLVALVLLAHHGYQLLVVGEGALGSNGAVIYVAPLALQLKAGVGGVGALDPVGFGSSASTVTTV